MVPAWHQDNESLCCMPRKKSEKRAVAWHTVVYNHGHARSSTGFSLRFRLPAAGPAAMKIR
jgi:hypothetical protein